MKKSIRVQIEANLAAQLREIGNGSVSAGIRTLAAITPLALTPDARLGALAGSLSRFSDDLLQMQPAFQAYRDAETARQRALGGPVDGEGVTDAEATALKRLNVDDLLGE